MSETRKLQGDVPREIFTEFRVEVIRRGLTMGEALTQAALLWLNAVKKQDKELIRRAEQEVRELIKSREVQDESESQ